MLLGYIVSQHGIEANPKKFMAITKMGPNRDIKGMQKVMGCLAALSRFISRSLSTLHGLPRLRRPLIDPKVC
jgi:hypothetical protein